MKNTDDYQMTCRLIKSLLCDRTPTPFDEDVSGDSPELSEVLSRVSEIRQAITALGGGDLEFRLTHKGYLSGVLKTLQASLRHLTWQTQSIAAGDFSQKVDFMGDFSDSFNQMTAKLEQTVTELKQSREKYKLLADFASDVIWVSSIKERKYTYISPSVIHLRGYTPDEVLSQSLSQVIADGHVDYFVDLVLEKQKLFIESEGREDSFRYELQLIHKDGTPVWTEASVRFRYNENNEIELVGVTRNIEERKKAENRVNYLSYHDQMTDLFNRRYHEEAFLKLDSKDNLPLSIVVVDINGLKLTNDAFGHKEGDGLIRTIADILKSQCREGDVLSRIGGDEFVFLMPSTDLNEAEALIDCMKDTIRSRKKEGSAILSASFGCATKNHREESLEAVFTAADDNMYSQKLKDSSNMKNKTIKMIINSLFGADKAEKEHCERVSQLCVFVGKTMKLSSEQIGTLKQAGMFHDIGKVALSETILNKKGELSENEWEEIKRHPEIGYQILKSSTDYANIAECILSHHEFVDGNGYPRGLSGSEITVESRILAVAEAFDDMIHDREYRAALSCDEAVSILQKESGKKFDADIVNIIAGRCL